MAKGIVIRVGNKTYQISAREHAAKKRAVRKLKREVLQQGKIQALSSQFVGKPQFIIERREDLVLVAREDCRQQIMELAGKQEWKHYPQLSCSEWQLDMKHRGFEEAVDLPITLHDVYEEDGITVKTGNPYRNNSWEEFMRALTARSLGLVEAKSPLGFSFWLDDIYGQKKPGKMFYKHLDGVDLDQAIKAGNLKLLNWALWEAAKFFSRLINANLCLEDSDRMGNYFIETNQAIPVFRFLDLEAMPFLAVYSNQQKAEMLARFIQKALKEGFLTEERLGEFIIVAQGSKSAIYSLVQQELLKFPA